MGSFSVSEVYRSVVLLILRMNHNNHIFFSSKGGELKGDEGWCIEGSHRGWKGELKGLTGVTPAQEEGYSGSVKKD